jgi:ATP-dependent exoDNAse (exonuclease V) beta subunit
MHAFAQGIEWLDEGVPSEATLRRHISDLPLDAAMDIAGELAQFRAMLEAPGVRSVLSRERYEALGFGRNFVVRREVPFAFSRQTGSTPKVVNGRFDRLVVGMDGKGHPTHAEVLDFKTDALLPGEDERAVAGRYLDQMELYRVAAARLTGLRSESVRVAMVLLSVGKVVNLDPNLRPLPDRSIIAP